MSRAEIHQAAEQSTPAGVTVPNTWWGLFIWAVGEWGTGAVFLCMLIPVYMDLRQSNERFASIAGHAATASQATAKAVDALAARVESSNTAIIRLDDAIRRLEAYPKR